MSNSIETRLAIKVADEVWIATALLHRESPDRLDFTVEEIVKRARKERLHPSLRPGVKVHAQVHCVANRPPNPGRYRMLVATGKQTRRLFREGDAYDPAREGSKILPSHEDIPENYHHLLNWYLSEYLSRKPRANKRNSILDLVGLGREIWVGEHADEYVRRLRRGWR